MSTEIRDQLQLFSIDSPCIGVCEVNNRGYCKGCFRSRDERFHWHQFSEGDKSKILKLCNRRSKRKPGLNKGDDEPDQPHNLSLF